MTTAAHDNPLNAWPEGEIRLLPLPLLGERYRRYRLPDAAGEVAMAGALTRYGQLSPLAVFVKDDAAEVLDGFKRLSAARSIPGFSVLRQLNFLFDALGRMESWLRHRGRGDLSSGDRRVLAPHFTRLSRDARVVAELADDLLTESELP